MPTNQVEYVDANAATNGNGLSPTTPRQKLQDAINHATGSDNRPYVHLAAGTYDGGGVNNLTIYLVGADGAIIAPGTGDALGVMGSGALTVRNLVASAMMGNGGNCGGGKFTAYRTQFVNNKQSGVYSSSSCSLKLDGCWLTGNSNGGVITDGQFTIINSIFAANTGNGGLYQRTNSTAPLVFANNTVADNSSTLSPAGVYCATGSALTVADTILWNNTVTGLGVGETKCATSFVASDDPMGGPTSTVPLSTTTPPGFKGTMPVSPDSYHLQQGSPCVDKGHTPVAYDHDYDFAPRPDAKTGKPDIGATELQQ